MTLEELKKAIHFRTIDAPCCGNCKYLEVAFGGMLRCGNIRNWSTNSGSLSGMNDNDVCDRFERREENHDN